MSEINGATTYIVATKSSEFYCGRTNDLDKRLKEHKKEKHPHWFHKKLRKEWFYVIVIEGNYERQIKRAGVRVVARLIVNLKRVDFK